MKFLPDSVAVAGFAAACAGLFVVAGLGLALLIGGIGVAAVGIALDRRAP